MRLRFGDCVYDDEARAVLRDGLLLDVSPKGLALLGALLQRRPAAMARQDLKDLLWPDTFVAETSLDRVVSELRATLGDTGAKAIRTVHRFGYAFSAAARAEDTSRSACALRLGREVIPLPDGEHVLGRSPESIASIASSKVSRRHSRLLVRGGQATIEDLGSKNGTLVNGRRIEAEVTLADGDEIGLGTVVVTFHAARPEGSTVSADREE